eukprot:232062-Rhodomonas_salina.1
MEEDVQRRIKGRRYLLLSGSPIHHVLCWRSRAGIVGILSEPWQIFSAHKLGHSTKRNPPKGPTLKRTYPAKRT